MATIDEILAAMPAEAAASFEYLTIDPNTREITVPELEQVFGVAEDRNAERKYFMCPRYVGDSLDLSAMYLTVYYRNANGDEDGYLVNDVAVSGELVTFSWLLSEKVTAAMGEVQFSVCAARTEGNTDPDWNTTLATGTVLEGMGHVDVGNVEEGTSDVMTQLRETVAAQTAAVEAEGAKQVAAVKAALSSRAAAIVCEAEGTEVQLSDASADPLLGLRIFGRSIQDGTPTPDAPVDIVSLTAPVVTVSDGTGDNVQTLTVTTPDGLPGIPVSSGGNYTDANGQQWIADEVDLARGVYVQRIKAVQYDGDTYESWALFTAEGVNQFYIPANNIYHPAGEAVILCGHYRPIVIGDRVSNFNAIYTSTTNICVNTQEANSVPEWRAILSNRPICVHYAIVTPIETPLSDAELQAWRSLCCYKPNTTVLNDAGAFMALEYAADPKTYIDNKLAALTAAT